MFVFNDTGPVFGPNGEWELDPDNLLHFGEPCYMRPAFATCKNNCPGGELAVLFWYNIISFSTLINYCEIFIISLSVNFPVVAGEDL